MPHLHTANFPSAHSNDAWYARLERVLLYSVAVYCPGWTVSVDREAPAPCYSAQYHRGHEFNTQKDDSWRRAVQAAPDGAQLMLIDVDAVVLGPLDGIWDRSFDVAYTVHRSTIAGPPFNSGVLFVRVSPAVKAFFDAWNRETHRLLLDPQAHEPLRRVYRGIHQSALGSLMERGATAGIDLQPVPCDEWNCDPAFDEFSDTTKVLHIKSGLRRAVFLGNRGYSDLVAVWRGMERAAIQQAVRA